MEYPPTWPIEPLAAPPDAEITVPGSKSLTNRALIVAALADGRSELRGALVSDDAHWCADGLRRLGIAVTESERGTTLTVKGQGGRIPRAEAELYAGNAGTAARFLTALVSLGHGRYVIDGAPRMRERPIGHLVEALVGLGVRAETRSSGGCPPVVVEAAGLPGGRTQLDASRSSQFLSALLLVAPYARRNVEVAVRGEVVSQPYVAMTLRVMADCGVSVDQNNGRFRVRAGRGYRARAYAIEPDASGASYFLAAAALTGGRVRVPGLGRDSAQGDARFADVLERMGCAVERGEDFIEVRGPERLRGVDVDLNAMSDMTLTLAAIAPFAESPTRIRNVAHIRGQESDRLAALATELGRLGVRVRAFDDGLEITPGPLRPAMVRTYDDHRIAMAFAVAGLRASGVVIADPGCVSKTFPDFFERLDWLRRPA